MNILSLCDGMSGGQIALKELNIPVENYYASEVDETAMKVTLDNFEHTIMIGDVMNLISSVTEDGIYIINEDILRGLPRIDLVMFGSPCRSLSKTTAGREEYNGGLAGASKLFYPCASILQWVKENNNQEVKFLVENVDSNNKTDLDKMSNILGVPPILIDSALFSAQDRRRNYWTNIPLQPLPESNPLVINDILDEVVNEKYFYNGVDFEFFGENVKICGMLDIKGHDIIRRINSRYFKSPTLTACRGGNHQKKVYVDGRVRKLTPNEYRKLQTVPEWFVMNVADTHIYNMCGDGWTIEVIKFILSGLIN